MKLQATLGMLAISALVAMPIAVGAAGTKQEEATSGGAALHLTPEKVKEVQKMLNKQGYDPGNVDGVWGEGSEVALKNFQQKKGLEPTGNIDMKTLSQLGIKRRGTPSFLDGGFRHRIQARVFVNPSE